MRAIKRNGYQLLIGENSLELFDYFKTEQLHGLSRIEAEKYTDTPEDAYIYGMVNFATKPDRLPYLFLNKRRMGGTYKDIIGMNHEYLHLARLLFNGITDENEEEAVTFIEEEISFIVDNGIIGVFQQPSTTYM